MIKKLNKTIGRFILDKYKRSKQSSANTSLSHCLHVAHRTIGNTKYCFLISNGSDNFSSARYVEPIVEDDLSTIWIGTNPELRKIKEIQENPNITLAFGDTRERANIVIYGEASVESDITLRKRYWKNEWRLFFPNGPIGDDYILIKVRTFRMEIMSFHRNVIQEPFGLKPISLIYQDNKWNVANQ